MNASIALDWGVRLDGQVVSRGQVGGMNFHVDMWLIVCGLWGQGACVDVGPYADKDVAKKTGFQELWSEVGKVGGPDRVCINGSR